MSNGDGEEIVTIELHEIRADLDKIVVEHGPEGATLELVESVQRWSMDHGFQEGNPFRQATAFPDAGKIVMLERLSSDHARSSSSLLRIGPIAHEWLATDLRRYADFLLFHEIAHLRGLMTEREADEWAIARVRERWS